MEKVGAEDEVTEGGGVVAEHSADFAHGREAIVIFGTENESTQSAERRLEQNGQCSVQC